MLSHMQIFQHSQLTTIKRVFIGAPMQTRSVHHFLHYASRGVVWRLGIYTQDNLATSIANSRQAGVGKN